MNALGESAFEVVPIAFGNNSGDGIKRKDAFRPLVVIINGEGNALLEKCLGGEDLFSINFSGAEFAKALEEGGVMGATFKGGGEHFIIEVAGGVMIKKLGHGW